MLRGLTHAICSLALAIREFSDNRRTEFEWFKSHYELATKHDLEEMVNVMALKLSELGGTIQGLKAQVQKIWNEQQAKYDALVVKYGELEATLANVELPAEADTELTEFKTLLQAFDDTIPDPSA